MLRFFGRRILFGVLVMWVVATAVFLLYFVAPNDVARTLAGKEANPATVAAIRHSLGLDRPLLDQYGHFLWKALHGNLGYSYFNSTPVTTLISQRIWVTASLAGGGAVIWLVVGVLVGVLASSRPRSVWDRASTGMSVLFFSMPTFLLGEVLLFLLFYQLHLAGVDLFPATGYVPFDQNPLAWAQHLILPWTTIALVTAATYVRLTRSSMLEVLEEDYIRTARSKGMPERRVVYRHGLRAAVTPVLTQFGIDLGTLLGGAIVTENVFGLPGLGQLIVTSVVNQDLPTIIGLVLLASAFVVVANIAVDFVYAFVDPRVRLT